MMTPTSALGAPIARDAGLDARASALASRTTTTRHATSRKALSAATFAGGAAAWIASLPVGVERQEIIAVADDLREDERAVEDQRNDGDEDELARREHRARVGDRCSSAGSASARRSRQASRAMRSRRGGRSSAPGAARRRASRHSPTMPVRMIITAAKTVSRASAVVSGTARQHQRHDQRDFDHGDRDRQHQRAERLAHAVRDDLGVVHRGQHARRSARRRRAPGYAPPSPNRRSAEEQPGDDRRGEGPERQEGALLHSGDYSAIVLPRPENFARAFRFWCRAA